MSRVIGKGGSIRQGAHAVDSAAQMAAHAKARGECYGEPRYTVTSAPGRNGVVWYVWRVQRYAWLKRDGGVGWDIRKQLLKETPFEGEAKAFLRDCQKGKRVFAFAGTAFKPRSIR